MKIPPIPERIDIIKKDVGITEDAEFGRLCGMSKSVVNQLRTEKMKSIAARYAYKLQDKTGFSARWIQLGEGQMKLSSGQQSTNAESADPILADLAALLPEDSAVWRAQIRAAAIKMSRQQGVVPTKRLK